MKDVLHQGDKDYHEDRVTLVKDESDGYDLRERVRRNIIFAGTILDIEFVSGKFNPPPTNFVILNF